MKILIVNGSPRTSGNTRTALNQISLGIQTNIPKVEIELLDVSDLKLSGCTNCDACRKNGGSCIIPDDSAEIIQKIYDTDVLILGTPVYYWGMTSQLKMVIDKLYSKDDQLRQQKKKLGVVAVGEASLDDPEYKLISDQFEFICNYLGWDLIFSQSVCAFEAGDLAKDKARLQDLNGLWKSI